MGLLGMERKLGEYDDDINVSSWTSNLVWVTNIEPALQQHIQFPRMIRRQIYITEM